MREPPFDPKASKQTVSLSINSDLYALAKGASVNVSRVAEQALEVAYSDHRRKLIEAEIKVDLEALDAYAEKHGLFADFVRAQSESIHWVNP
jgi:post-segregation antitoxin (ccd killing protein)